MIETEPTGETFDLASDQDPVLDQAFDWLERLRAAPVDAATRAACDAWMQASPAHGAAYRRAQEIWLLTGLAPRAAAPVARPLDLLPPSRRGFPARKTSWIGMAIVACIAVFAVPALRLEFAADYRTADGETRQVPLPDGSVVTLDGGSAVALGDQIGARAIELLSGRAFFDVAKDHGRSFTVQADGVSVTVHGTAFDVWMTSGLVSVTVKEGAVSVAASGSTVDLAPGDRVSVDKATGQLRVDQVATDSIAAWRAGQLVVKGLTVAEVVEELQRYHAGIIMLPSGNFTDKRVSGVFNLHDVEGALSGLTRAYGARLRKLTRFILVIDPT